jgi:hypothetical protein
VPRDGAEPVRIELRWTPQRTVRWGLLAGLVSVAACVVVAVWPRRAARPWPVAVDPPPELCSPLAPTPPLTVARGVVVSGVTALGAWLVIGPWAALAAAALTILAALAPRARAVAGLAGVAGIVAVGAFYVIRQIDLEPLEGFGWVKNVEAAHRPALLAVVLLAADVAIRAPVPRRAAASAPADAPRLEAEAVQR